jgi:hypothetical protein
LDNRMLFASTGHTDDFTIPILPSPVGRLIERIIWGCGLMSGHI